MNGLTVDRQGFYSNPAKMALISDAIRRMPSETRVGATGDQMKRLQARGWRGRFTRNTPENTLGLHIVICPHCRAFNCSDVGKPRPLQCHTCRRDMSVSGDLFQDPPEIIAKPTEEGS